ncbi:hypothetical protein MRB53_003898 [Persea americana]|uniref:Uncharacterized protein n=1 Tax=Persea americana TaxID=3435 RepID=A0ACC2MYQ2_PERAE|nr:hypothetical protein MRB53_003898 [Persea americana]
MAESSNKRPWTKAEREEMVNLLSQKQSHARLVKRLKRSYDDIIEELKKMIEEGDGVPPTTLAQVQAAAAEVASAARNNQAEISDNPVARQMLETIETDLGAMFYEREKVREKVKELYR